MGAEDGLLKSWAAFAESRGTSVLEGDRVLLETPWRQRWIAEWDAWASYVEDDAFGRGGDTKLHVNLLPVPFVGDLARARVVLLLLNPGLDPTDYFGEGELAGFRDRLRRNLAQDFTGIEYPFFYLDPALSWHAGFAWWQRKLGRLIERMANELQVSYREARKMMSRRIAALQLVPYHSESYCLPARLEARLASVRLVRTYLHQVLLPRVSSGRTVIIAMRKVKAWGLRDQDGVVCFSATEARGAHLTPGSRAGDMILNQLRMTKEAR